MYRQLHGDLVALFGAEARAETRRAARDIADDGGAAMTAATPSECRNPPCVGRDHLTPLTPAEHRMAHSELQTHCHKGHEFAPQNTYVRPDGRRRCRTCQRQRQREAASQLHEAFLRRPSEPT